MEQAGRLDIELVERLETELKQAHLELEQARAALQERSPLPDTEPVHRLETGEDQAGRDLSDAPGDVKEQAAGRDADS